MRAGRAVSLFVAAILVCAAPIAAQEAGPLNSPILTLEQDRLFTGTLYGKAVQARIDTAAQALQAENRKIEADLEAEERDLTEQRAKMEPLAFRKLADAFDEKANAIRAARMSKARTLSEERDSERKVFLTTAAPIIAKLMTEAGAVAIVDKTAIILSFDRIDITDAAIARIDEVLGDGTRPPENAPPEPGLSLDPAPAPTPDVVPEPLPEPSPAPQVLP